MDSSRIRNLAETFKSYLTADTTDEVLDLEIFENHLGDRYGAVAIQPEAGTNFYGVDALPEYADFCPERILDILTPTDNSDGTGMARSLPGTSEQ